MPLATLPRMQQPRTSRAAQLAVFLVTLPPLYGLWLTQGPPMEEGFMLVFPELVLNGSVPNRDFLHLYGPGSLWVLAAVFALTGVKLGAERAVGYLQILGVVFGIQRLLRPWGPWISGGGGVIAAIVVLTPSGLTAMAWIGALALGLWALSLGLEAGGDPGTRAGSRRALGAGVLAGLALLYRLDLALAVAAAGALVAVRLDRAARARAAAGLALGLSPYLIHLAMAGPANVLRGQVLAPVFDLRDGRRLPLPPDPQHFDGFLQGAGALEPPPWPLPAPGGPRQLWLWFFALLVTGVLLIVAGLIARRRNGDIRLLAIAAFSVGLYPQALQRPDSTHIAWVGCVAFAVLPAALVELHRSTTPRRALPAVAAPLLMLLFLAPHFTFRPYAEATAKTLGWRRVEQVIEHRGRRFPYKRADAVAAVREMLPEVEARTQPGDTLVVGPGDLRKTPYSEAFLYYLLPDLVPGTRYIEMDPGIANAPDSGLAAEIAAADVVILSTIRDDWNEPNGSLSFGSPEPNEVLARNFCLTGSYGIDPFDADRGLYELYTRC